MYGNIVLANTKSGFVPSAIRWMTNSNFSHSLITVPDTIGTPMCIEAAENGVDFTRFDKNYRDNLEQDYEVWTLKIDQPIKDAAIVSILNDLEMSYGYLEFFFFGWRKLCTLLGKDVKNQKNWINQGMICSQLCVAYLKSCGLEHVLDGYGEGSVAPGDLHNIFTAHPDVFELSESVRT